MQWRDFLPKSLEITANGNIVLRQVRPQVDKVYSEILALDHRSIVWPGLMVLHFIRDDQTSFAMVLMGDSTDRISFQRLRVAAIWLRQHRQSEADNKIPQSRNLN